MSAGPVAEQPAPEADEREAKREAMRRVMVSEPDSVAREHGYQEGFEAGAEWRARRSQPAPRTVTVGAIEVQADGVERTHYLGETTTEWGVCVPWETWDDEVHAEPGTFLHRESEEHARQSADPRLGQRIVRREVSPWVTVEPTP
jgi:hypothetical protein